MAIPGPTHGYSRGFPDGSPGKEFTCNAGDLGSIPELGRSPWRTQQPENLVFWPGEFYGLYRPWGRKEVDITERLSLSTIHPGGSDGKESACNAGDPGTIPG